MNTHQDHRPIIVGVDGSSSSIEALRAAADLARVWDAPLEAVTAWQFPVGFDGSFPAEMWSPGADAESLLSSAVAAAFPRHVTTHEVDGGDHLIGKRTARVVARAIASLSPSEFPNPLPDGTAREFA